MRLNGWQRLWVVGTILWTIFIGFQVWKDWPPPTSTYRYAVPDDIASGNRPSPKSVDEFNADLAQRNEAISYLETHALMAWVLPPVLAYGLGIGAVWIYRGFTSS